jgi:hypothetical protein
MIVTDPECVLIRVGSASFLCLFMSGEILMLLNEDQTMTLEVEDFTGQVRRRAGGIPRTATVGDLVESVYGEMQLPDQDSEGRPIQYGALSARGDLLNATDQLGDVLENEEVVTLTKSVTAGGTV